LWLAERERRAGWTRQSLEGRPAPRRPRPPRGGGPGPGWPANVRIRTRRPGPAPSRTSAIPRRGGRRDHRTGQSRRGAQERPAPRGAAGFKAALPPRATCARRQARSASARLMIVIDGGVTHRIVWRPTLVPRGWLRRGWRRAPWLAARRSGWQPARGWQPAPWLSSPRGWARPGNDESWSSVYHYSLQSWCAPRHVAMTRISPETRPRAAWMVSGS